MLVNVKPQNNPIIQGDYPIIMGNVLDQAYRPVTNANVLILYGSEAVTTTTDNQGNFRYTSAIPSTPGTYEIDVTVTKPGYIKQLASSSYTVYPYSNATNTTGNDTIANSSPVTGLPVTAGNYTVFLGKVAQWNLETTCMVDFSNKYMRFLKTCDLYKLDPQDFQQDQSIIPMVTVIQYNNTYRLFPDGIYTEAFHMGSQTVNSFVNETWYNYTAPN